MIVYLLDSNVCIDVLRGRDAHVTERFQHAVDDDAVLLLSSIVAAELWCGVSKSVHTTANAGRLQGFLAGPFHWAPFDEEDAQAAGLIRAELDARGQRIGAHDVLLAGQALRHHATLVTANTSEFSRIDGLLWEDWTQPLRHTRRAAAPRRLRIQ